MNIPISKPSFTDEEWLALKEPLDSGWLTQGPKVKAFEEAFAARHQVKHALAVTSCTTGLHLALSARGIGPGDEVIVPAFTWVATANVVKYCGAKPVFVDVDLDSYLMNIDEVVSKVSEKTKAIIPVHLFGLCVDVDKLRSMIPTDIYILEDAACAAGASIRNQSAGSLGDAAVFSLHPRKSITTGEGGMITTNNSELARKMEVMRNHGAEVPEEVRHHGPKPYLLPDFKVLGFNYRMTDLQAAVGIVQLNKLDGFIKERDQIAHRYHQSFKDVPWISFQDLPEGGQHSWQAFVMRIDESVAPLSRNEMMEILQNEGISTRPGTHCVTELSYYKEVERTVGNYPNAISCADTTIAIPLFNGMASKDVDHIVSVIKGF